MWVAVDGRWVLAGRRFGLLVPGLHRGGRIHAWNRPWTIWTHGAAALYGPFNVIVGWPCPLTHVEDWGRERAGEATLPGTGFIDHYIAGVVYPQEHETLVQLLVAAVVLTSWIGFAIRRRRS